MISDNLEHDSDAIFCSAQLFHQSGTYKFPWPANRFICVQTKCYKISMFCVWIAMTWLYHSPIISSISALVRYKSLFAY